MGHLSHAAVLLDVLAQRYTLEAAVTLPRNARFRDWIERRGYPVEPVGTVIGGNREFSGIDLLRHAASLAASTVSAMHESRRVLERLRPHLVIGTGGRASFAPVLAAALGGYPTITVPHYALRRSNHLLARVVDRTCIAREQDLTRFPAYLRHRLRLTGTPLRPEAFAHASKTVARERLGLDPVRPVVGLIGYSAGSTATARLMADVMRLVRARHPEVQFVVQHGAHPPPGAGGAEGVVARPFFDDLLSVFPACEVAVTAAGETTLLELCARGVASVCISLPDTPIGPHIAVLGRDLEAAGAAVFLPVERTTVAAVAALVDRLLEHPEERRRMARAGWIASRPDAVQSVLHVISELLQERYGSTFATG
ncbi:UDP-N-acetylglucosamine--N-acetylmuramyl-(pentapeptide) pyrophosphoryl-undecaprenol N-acetylglucosamine transferase [Longimicrobium sp.]|uniref:UDP-N-acetylglucosamine--N-acetylmuramyl- (pentapeptide) pyrophosphoryl-undecaprenol N-acetylglucosamine transferase n=1 Tax=Longimicrobium sp. TaxID=2029185 RepID=UPI002E34D9D0|nr:UDP-N-acetylglucosamine--N-acetylmuramyl-(pentapeptide) pyrophosphoryl-undecaprenol N-acetylglucosamine transferase [Longimicrobium sp.]HEX6041621.1 UDP-N-acetylglucosamine--N-acetylmuramyl-(pentapeptide) pyrophosphoryl-undecaprenol N-acetylglucosamine transferase [Longimicrobium sp.]